MSCLSPTGLVSHMALDLQPNVHELLRIWAACPTTGLSFVAATCALWVLGVWCWQWHIFLDVSRWKTACDVGHANNNWLPCDLFMFYMGVLAEENGWFESPVRKQLDINIRVLRILVIGEGIAMCALFQALEQSRAPTLFTVMCVFGIAGVYCVDMSLVMLELFQSCFNYTTEATRFLADAAYGVYIFHMFAISVAMAVVLKIYSAIAEEEVEFASKHHDYRVTNTMSVASCGTGLYCCSDGHQSDGMACSLVRETTTGLQQDPVRDGALHRRREVRVANTRWIVHTSKQHRELIELPFRRVLLCCDDTAGVNKVLLFKQDE